jgi:hypothetical protein
MMAEKILALLIAFVGGIALTALVGTKLINLARHGHKLHVCEEHFRKGSLQ